MIEVSNDAQSEVRSSDPGNAPVRQHPVRDAGLARGGDLKASGSPPC